MHESKCFSIFYKVSGRYTQAAVEMGHEEMAPARQLQWVGGVLTTPATWGIWQK
jgi:hypothetical protein